MQATGKSVLSNELKSQDSYLLLGDLGKLSDFLCFHFLIRVLAPLPDGGDNELGRYLESPEHDGWLPSVTH